MAAPAAQSRSVGFVQHGSNAISAVASRETVREVASVTRDEDRPLLHGVHDSCWRVLLAWNLSGDSGVTPSNHVRFGTGTSARPLSPFTLASLPPSEYVVNRRGAKPRCAHFWLWVYLVPVGWRVEPLSQAPVHIPALSYSWWALCLRLLVRPARSSGYGCCGLCCAAQRLEP